VMDEFRFHMTLTGPIPATEQALYQAALEAFFSPVLGSPLPIGALTLAVEAEPGAAFIVKSQTPFMPQARNPARHQA